jgi:serine/threonine protein kinase
MVMNEIRFEHLPTFLPHDEADARSRPESFEAGDVFAERYQMVARIGRGGTADVWHADDLLLQTPVALKLIHSTKSETRRQIINEVRLARQITHPAVCRVFDVGETGDTVFYSMELVRGDLRTLLKRAGRLPSEKVIDIAHQLCTGLAAAHAKDVLHGDLKPANVLVDDDGLVQITDFGVAVTRAEAVRSRATKSPDSMAPEQKEADARLSEQADLHALAVVLYELLTGQHPFKPAAPWRRVLKPSALFPDVNPQLEGVLMKALAPRMADRPPSAAAFADGLPKAERRSKAIRSAGSRLARRQSRPWLREARSWARCLCW